jgi:hypothetical protein
VNALIRDCDIVLGTHRSRVQLGISWVDALAVVVSAVGVYVAFLVLVRIVGQRALAALSSFDFAADHIGRGDGPGGARLHPHLGCGGAGYEHFVRAAIRLRNPASSPPSGPRPEQFAVAVVGQR